MFELDPSDELAVLAETARQFAADELLAPMRDAEAARAVGESARRAWAQIGLDRLELPESLGGAGLGSVARALVNEELAAADPGAVLALDTLGVAGPVLEACGLEVLERVGLPLLERPGARAVVAWAPDCSLVEAGGRVSGEIPYVPSEAPDVLLLLGPDRLTLLEGDLQAEPVRGAGLRAAGASGLRLDGVRVAEQAAGEGGARALARVRLYFASLLLGVMRHACDFSRAYALERRAFGKPIAHHQALAFMITDMQMALDGARLLVQEAAWRIDEGIDAEAEAAAAFAQCIESARAIGPNGVQILGGHGFMADYPMEKAMREARALGLLAGGFDAAIECAGQRLCESGDFVPLGVAS